MDSRVHARYLDVRLFLEGIEVDVTSIKVGCGINQPATATLTIPSVDAAHKLLPRTLVHVFFFDSRYELGTSRTDYIEESDTNPFYEGDKDKHQFRNSTPEAHKAAVESGEAVLLTDKDDWHNWKLLFTGEVIGYSFAKMGGRREIVLSCIDHTSYWNNCRLYWGQKRSSVFNAYKTAVFSGATHLHRGKSKVDSSNDLINLLNKRPSSMPNVPGLMGGIFSVLESATGVYWPTSKSKFRGANDFLSQAEIRLKLTRQIGASTKDDTSATFTTSKSFKRYIRKVSKAVSYTASFMQFVNMLCGKIYHVWHSQLAPPYFEDSDEVETEYTITGVNKFKHNSNLKGMHAAIEATYGEANRQEANARKRRGKLESGSIPISLNRDYLLWNERQVVDVVTHQKFDLINQTKGIMSSVTGVPGANTLLVTDLQKDPIFLKGHELKKELMAKAKGNKVEKALRRQADAVQQAYRHVALARMRAAELINAQELDTNYDEELSSIQAGNLKHTHIHYAYIRRELELALKHFGRGTGKPTNVVTKKTELNDRLYTTYFHPDLYMCPPPKCNVIFPDHIQSIRFSRNWMSEISRLWLHGRAESGRNKKDCYFSPNGIMLAGPNVGDCAQAVKKGGGFAMRHEKYTGIIPSIMGLGDNDIFKKLHKKELRKAKKEFQDDPSNAGKTFDAAAVSGEAKFSPQPHLQRAANYMFFAQRYATRSMQVTCRYSPQLIAGMPALVLDPVRQKSRVLAQVGGDGDNKNDLRHKGEVNLANKPAGTHYIGTIAELSHIIDVDGGAQTLVTLVKCREHREGSNLYGEPDEDGILKAVRTRKGTKEIKIKPPTGEPFTAAITRQSGAGGVLATDTQPSSAERIIGKQFRKGVRYKITPLPPKKGEPVGDGYRRTFMAPEGAVTSSAAEGTGTARNLDVDGNDLGAQEAVAVEVHRYYKFTKKEDVSFTWEASVMPPWFSSIYRPANIGRDYYTPMYGCVSVLDKPPVNFKTGYELADSPAVHTSVVGGKAVEADESESPTGIATILVPFKVSGPGGQGDTEYTEIRIPQHLTEPAATTEAAADNLADIWLALKEIGAQSDLFVDGYVDRKYATMVDIMGNQNPHFILKMYDPFNKSAHQMGASRRGFHGDAYGPYKLFKDWEGKDIIGASERLPAIKNINSSLKPRKIDPALDPRYVRYNRVREYINALRNQGFRNVAAEYNPERSEMHEHQKFKKETA
tara:strand:- start:1504 stop:5160 length:3657 start_codon:yes stop_codon:yes gene_type:complete